MHHGLVKRDVEVVEEVFRADQFFEVEGEVGIGHVVLLVPNEEDQAKGVPCGGIVCYSVIYRLPMHCLSALIQRVLAMNCGKQDRVSCPYSLTGEKCAESRFIQGETVNNSVASNWVNSYHHDKYFLSTFNGTPTCQS